MGVLASVAVLLVNAGWVSARLGVVHKPKRVLEVDHYHYLAMARGEDSPRARRAPYCWRLFVPSLAGWMRHAGVNVHLAFYLITNVSLFGFLLALFYYLGQLGFDLRLRLLGLTLAGMIQGAVRWFEYQYWMTDPLSLFLVVLGLLAARKDKALALAALSLFAAFVRETYILVFPYYFFVLLAARPLREALARTVFVAAAPVTVSILLRLLIHPEIQPGLLASMADAMSFRFGHLFDNQLYLMTLGTWGVLVPLALLFPGRLTARGRLPELALLATVYLSTILISNNNERPLAYALPAVLPAALRGFERLLGVTGLPFAGAAALVLLLQAYVYSQTLFLGLGISIYQPARPGVAAALLAAWLAGRACIARRAPPATGAAA